MKYLAVLGRLSDISLAELAAQFGPSVEKIAPNLAVFESDDIVDINRFGGTLKFGRLLTENPIDFLLVYRIIHVMRAQENHNPRLCV